MSDFNEMATEIGRLEPDDVSKGAQLAGAMFDQYIADKIYISQMQENIKANLLKNQ